MHLVEDVDDVQALAAGRPRAGSPIVTQTTLSVDDAAEIIGALKAKFPSIRRAEEAGHLLRHAEPPGRGEVPRAAVRVVIVVGSPNSSNSNRLRELAEKRGMPAYMVDSPTQIDPEWVEGKKRIGVTAGASAPEVLAQAVIARLAGAGREKRASAGRDRGRRFLFRCRVG